MPELKNVRWEKFSQLRAKGCTMGAAYAEAYEKTEAKFHSGHGSRLAQKTVVAQRIEELRPRSEATSSGDLDPEFVIQNLLQVLQKAVDSGKFSSANRTLELLGKFQGMFADSKRDNRTVESNLPDFYSMTHEEQFNWFASKMSNLKPSWVLVDRRTPLAAEGKRDELVRHFRDQLRGIDPDITVFDPKEVQAKPTEDGGTASSELH